MTGDLTLSHQVQSFLDTLDHEEEQESTPSEREELREMHRVVNLIVDDVIASRETLTDGNLAAIEKLVEQMPETIAALLDGRYTRDVVSSVPGYVRRTMELSRLAASHPPSKMTNGYLREAVRTYIFGLPQASIALSRAALEQALKESLGYQGTGTFVKMNDLLDEAMGAGVLDNLMRKAARQIADDADDVLHEKPADSKKAYEVLLALRGVLQRVYSD